MKPYTLKRMAMVATMLLACSVSYAQYPDKNITLVVPYAVGGTTDALGRMIAEKMSTTLGKSIVVENVAGAGSTIGTNKVVRSPKDGYTLLFNNMSQALMPSLYPKLTFDPIKDIEPVGLIAHLPMMLVAKSDYPPKDIKELIEHIRKNGKNLNIANAGVGGSTHLCALMIQDALGVQMNNVPYKGSGPALIDLMGGQVDLLCDSPGSSTGHIKAGKLKGYALAANKRISEMPDVPTFAEAGYSGMDLTLWHGLYAPKDTPPEIVQKLAHALQQTAKNEDFRNRLSRLSIEVEAVENVNPEPLRKMLISESKRWSDLYKRIGYQP